MGAARRLGVVNDRAIDARARAALAEASSVREAVEAQRLIDDFIASATAHGPTAVPLKAVSPKGVSVATGRRGWYLRRNHTLAIGDDGAYLLLALMGEPTLLERLRGVTITPQRPSLTVGRGGRDGESGDLADFLTAALRGL